MAGAGLGGLLGLLVGMSASPVAAIVVSALAALLGGIFSATPGGRLTLYPDRIASFSAAATVALLGGLFLRTHNVLTPSLAYYVKELTSVGIPAGRAVPLAVRLKFGVSEQGEVTPLAASSRSDSIFFSDQADMRCSNTAREDFQSSDLWLAELARRGFAPLLEETRNFHMDERQRVLLAARKLLCA